MKKTSSFRIESSSSGCLSSLLSFDFGLVNPSLSVWLMFSALGIEFIGLIFAQHLTDWAAEIYIEEDEGEQEQLGKAPTIDPSSPESSTKASRKAAKEKGNSLKN
ncbi:hypothetical protein KIN20_033784 [Parelaphostrongylus tenuis]|uniref:Uncharacterized protein n=1 Tax=Parelaphostrongylus tenuis TaxID=148309 RepID=A0AAD5WII7_PARTN|nr:hypothetical protein KIN20_033784 [Parelaphostrongylus tenuis]